MFTPNEPEKPKNSDNLDDLFSSPPNTGESGSLYTPPLAQPQQQQRRTSPVLYIILGIVVASMCICVGCVVVTGGSIFAIAQNPTVKAAVGTGMALGEAPEALPPGASVKGTLTSGQQQSGQLSDFGRDVWKYVGKKGEQITVSISAQDRGLQLIFGVYDTDGKRLVKNSLFNSAQPNQSLAASLPDEGTYSILVSSLGGTANSNGNYTITVNSSEAR